MHQMYKNKEENIILLNCLLGRRKVTFFKLRKLNALWEKESKILAESSESTKEDGNISDKRV